MMRLRLVQRRVIATPADDGPGWLAMDDDGKVTWHRTRKSLVDAVRRFDGTLVGDDGIALTTIEWRSR
jgi:hypothetical protein